MLEQLIARCVHRRMAAVLVALAVAAVGLRAYLATPIEAYPDVTNAQVTVIAKMPGYAPEEVERQVTVPLERVLNGTPGMVLLRSESLFGLSLVTLTFDDGLDALVSRTHVSQRIATADLPPGVVPELAPDDTPLGEIYQFTVQSDRHDLYELRSELEWNIARLLEQVPGVADVVNFGGLLKELHAEVDPLRLEAHGLTLPEVTDALSHSNLNVGGGFLTHGEQEMAVRGVGYLRTADDVKNVVLRSGDGIPVTVGDVATVVQSYQPRRGTVGLGTSREAVEGFALLRRGENPTEVLDAIHRKVREINDSILPAGMTIVPFADRSTLVEQTLHTVHHNLLVGFLLVVGVVWLFLRSVRGSLIVAAVIPLAILTAFIGLSLCRLPANPISLGAVDFGILLDGAVVLVESVVHRLHTEKPRRRREISAVVIRSALDVARPTFYAMTIVIAALVPVFALERVEGRIFRPLSLTYTFALVGALVFSLTVVPALCALVLQPRDGERGEPHFVAWLRAAHGRILDAFLAHRRLVVGGALALAAGVGLIAVRLGTEFLPELDEGDLVIFVEMPPSISLGEGRDLLLDVRRRLLAFPEVIDVLSEQGRPEDGTDDEGVNMSETFVRLKPKGDWPASVGKEELVEAMRASLTEIPGVRFNFSQPIKDNVEEAMSGVRGKVVLKIFGPDLDAMRTTLERAQSALRTVAGITDLELYRDAAVPQLQIELDRHALARNGVQVQAADDIVETALAGKVATTMWEGERPVPLRVMLPAGARSSAAEIGDIAVPTSGGAHVPLRDLAAIRIASGRASINREANSRYQALKFNVENRDLGSAVAEAQRVVAAAVQPPAGHYFVWGGEFENQQRAMARLRVIVPVALGLVLALLYGALSSGRSAAAILAAAPFALTGGVLAVALAGIPLSVSATIGFIALLGQVSLMGLLVLSAIERRRRDGEALEPAVRAGACERVRAVTMASLLALLGLLPMALSSAPGSEIQQPFAVVIVGGMLTTPFVALLVLPILYTFITPAELHTPEELDEEWPLATAS